MHSPAVTECREMLANMSPELQEGTFIYCATDKERGAALIMDARGMVAEKEGWTLILPTETAAANGFDTSLPMAQITLGVYSALHGVGLTAAVAGALAKYQIPCNVVAAYHHDHIFLPFYFRAKAMRIIQELQASAQQQQPEDVGKDEDPVEEEIKQK